MFELRASRTGDYWRWLWRRYRRFRVQGRSMLPTLTPDTELLYDPAAYITTAPQNQDIIIARHPIEDILIVKRIAAVLPDSRLVLSGDNRRESSDSRSFGPLDPGLVLGKVICTFP